MNSSQAFVAELKRYSSANVFNPYQDVCDAHDKKTANIIRARNLKRALDAFASMPVDALWIGRDLGYRGGRRTGLALVDEDHLDMASKRWQVRLEKATKGPVVRERTAAKVWQLLRQIREPVFMWNIFPFHPHLAGQPLSNRSHTAQERDAGLVFLQALVELLEPQKLVAIGNDAFNCAERIFSDRTIYKIRHPSYGGEKIFAEQIAQLYEINGR